MAGCCAPGEYDGVFSDRFARRLARRYRRRGLDSSSRRLVQLVEQTPLAGASVLEIGGGLGEIQVELLRRGARHATNLELSSAYEAEARELLRREGLTGRVDRRIVDLATHPDDVPAADVVVLHRVVCCYPDPARLLAVAAEHSRRVLAFSYPPRHLVSRAVLGAENTMLRLSGKEFRVFAHPPRLLRSAVEERGLREAGYAPGLVWRVVAFTR